jgi:hypothetical protein
MNLSSDRLDATKPVNRGAARAAALVVAAAVAGMLGVASARAGTYPMYQCGPAIDAVAAGWSVYGNSTQASTVLSNTCAGGGALGDYVFSNGTPGAVTENGSSGSQVGLQVNVPASFPDVTIQSLSAQALVSPATGDDAFLGFSSAGQNLPGAVELPYGTGSDYSSPEQWTLPLGARDFQAYVNCSTDRSSPTCNFSDSTHVPAFNDVTLNLAEATPPALADVSGTLASAAAAGAKVSGAQTLSFDASDNDSGVRSAAVILTPQATGTPARTTVDYGAKCAYDSWNACPLTETANAVTINTAQLPPGAYAVDLAATDAAGNTTTDHLGSVTVDNVPHIPNGSPCTGPQLTLTFNGKRRLGAIRYGRRVLIRGRLHCAATAIPGAVVKLAGVPDPRRITTGPDGTFSYRTPGGPSRTLSFSYRAFSDDPRPAVSVRVKLSVRAVLSLRIGPRRTHNDGTIRWHGRIAGGPYPRGGLTVLVQVRVGHRWETFDQLITRNGRFAYRYTFRRTKATTTYAFRVTLPVSGAAGYRYLPASSPTVTVTVRP